MLKAAAMLVLAAATAAPAPTSSPAPLREIGRVRSRTLCATLRENIAPTLLKVMEADVKIAAGANAFASMSNHQIMHDRGRMQFDRMALGNAVMGLARSIIEAERLLEDKHRFPAAPSTDDERDAAAMKSQIEAVLAQQKAALNVMSGVYETELMGQMQKDLPDTIKDATAQTESHPRFADTDDGVSYLGRTGLAAASPPPKSPPSMGPTHALIGATIYGGSASSLVASSKRIEGVESLAAAAVMNAAADCRRTPAPVPSPSALP
ncbi:MAG TPA: hypothetical protein VGN14_11550 [Candidatus Elarobacter sp.]